MKKFNCFSDYGKFRGIKPRQPKTPAEVKCKVCGSVMRHVPGTNVFVCTGEDNDGKPCQKTWCKPVHRASNGLI